MYHHKVGLDEPSLEDELSDIPDGIAIEDGFWGINGGAKRTVDVLISLLALVFLAPLMLLVFVAIKCDGGGAFYVQSRVGRAGKLWQVKGRNRLSFEQRAALGTDYVRRWTLGRDLWILLLTVPALLSSTGAY